MENVQNVIPYPGFVVLEPVEIKEIAGLALPESQIKQNLRGKVIAVGGDWKNEHGVLIQCPAKVGDVTIYRQYNEQEIEINYKKYILAKFADLMGKVK